MLAEMYAYSLAAAHVNLPHQQMEQYMVSNTDAGGEGWPWVDKLPDVCLPPENRIYFPHQPIPTVLHFCQYFGAGGLGFYKAAMPKNIFSCAEPLLADPTPDMGRIDLTHISREKQREELKAARKTKRSAFALCILHRSINAALIDFKAKYCNSSAEVNLKHEYRLPTHRGR